MKRMLFFLFATITSLSSCTKNSTTPVPPVIVGTGNLTIAATLKILTANNWWLTQPNVTYPPGYLHFMLHFSIDNHYYQNGGTVVFGMESTLDPHGFGNDSSTDSYNITVSNNSTYLTITDNVAAVSLTNFSTYYQITSINSSGFTVASTNQVISTAPQFPSVSETYVAEP